MTDPATDRAVVPPAGHPLTDRAVEEPFRRRVGHPVIAAPSARLPRMDHAVVQPTSHTLTDRAVEHP